MTKLATDLRKKFPGRDGPRNAIKALGLDADLLDSVTRERARLAFDSSKENPMTATRLEALAIRMTARAINPLIALDKKVEYGPIFKGLTSKNLKSRKPTIMDSLKKALKGNTIAKDINIEHVGKMLDHMEHVKEPSVDESVSPEQHNAMEAAAHGHSTLGIPKDVGQEFAKADTGKSFDAEGFMEKMRGHGMSDDAIKDCMDALPFGKEAGDEEPEEALDESEEEKVEREKKEKEAKDEKEASEKEAKDKAAKDKHAMDKRLEGMVTNDAMDKAIKAAVETVRKSNLATMEAREFVRPYVGDLPMALDSADAVYRAAITAKGIEVEDLEKMPAAACKAILKTTAHAGAQQGGSFDPVLAHDTAAEGAASFDKFFPDAGRIKAVA